MKFCFLTLILAINILFVLSCKKDPSGNQPPETEANILSLQNPLFWKHSTVPLLFPESELTNNVSSGFNRAKISWYCIDPLFYNTNLGLRPYNISLDDISENECRIILQSELFPGIESPDNKPLQLSVIDLNYYPAEKGPWNFDLLPGAVSAGIQPDGKLNNPASRWGGIMRAIENPDFKINYLDFWIMDPFTKNPELNGSLYINLGDISEDILNDNLLSSEINATGEVIETAWGKVKPAQMVYNFPASNPELYDTGLDEMLDVDELKYFANYLDGIQSNCTADFSAKVAQDPSNDDYHYFLGSDYDELNYKVCDRYKNYNGQESNSFPANNDLANTISSRIPETEDLNHNGILNTENNYHEYQIKIDKEDFQIGSNYIVGKYTTIAQLQNGKKTRTDFYHFRIPLADFTASFGNPTLSSNPAFIRMFVTGFANPLVLRFINLELSEEPVDYSLFQ
jgi:cell surface protein SprA